MATVSALPPVWGGGGHGCGPFAPRPIDTLERNEVAMDKGGPVVLPKVIAALPLACGEQLRIVPQYRHLGAVATAAQRFAPEFAARTMASKDAETNVATRILVAPQIPLSCQLLVANAIHST